MTNLVDCMEEHEIESHGYDKSVASCPYYEIASDLLAALERANGVVLAVLALKPSGFNLDDIRETGRMSSTAITAAKGEADASADGSAVKETAK